jgi:D-alanyl-D-alanine carboxypeptidase/D-alanyl-D-alanine-endopeptidase (penicillin-binding protein 4)
VPGATTTDNPYDAVPTALAANFNTVNVQVDATGVTSAESQTPLTPTAKKIAMDLNKSGKFRVNIGRSSKLAGQYFAELLAAMLKDRGVEVNDVVEWGAAPDAAPVYVHRNSKTLGEIIEGMLKYSTNFIGNQLMLTMVAELTDRPASFDQVERYLDDRLSRNPGWSGFKLLEGAGLSPENRLTAMHLVQLLEKFRRWQHLLPEVHSGIIAKTGTLTGVKTLAGFAEDARGRQLPFAVLINQQVDASMPVQLIDALVNRN